VFLRGQLIPSPAAALLSSTAKLSPVHHQPSTKANKGQ